MYRNIVPLNSVVHRELKWTVPTRYQHLTAEVLAPISMADLKWAAGSYFTAFARISDILLPVILFGLGPRNLWVADDGQWLGPHMPVSWRVFPFTAQRGATEFVACIDEDAAVVSRSRGTAIFDAAGAVTPEATHHIRFALAAAAESAALSAAAAVLDQFGLIGPPLEWTTGSGEKRRLDNIHVLNIQAFEACSDETILTLRQKNALMLCYLHAFSQSNLANLIRYQDAYNNSAAPAAQKDQAVGGNFGDPSLLSPEWFG